MNETIRKFGYPATHLASFPHWVVLIRPAQVTAGSLILAARSEATEFGELDQASFQEFPAVVRQIEAALRKGLGAQKINYLMLMMVDPHVHFHVLPRYSLPQTVGSVSVPDIGWPGPPDLKAAVPADENMIQTLRERLSPFFEGTTSLA